MARLHTGPGALAVARQAFGPPAACAGTTPGRCILSRSPPTPMTPISFRATWTPAALDRLTSVPGALALWGSAGGLLAAVVPGPAALHPWLLASILALHLAHAARCRRRPPRVRSLAGFAWAPLGRLRRVPAATPLLAAKRYWFTASEAYQPMLVWVGWWCCGTFPGDPEGVEYVFFTRGSTRYALPARELVPAP